MEYYHKVTHRQYSGGKGPADLRALYEQEKQAKADAVEKAAREKKAALEAARNERKRKDSIATDRFVLEAKKRSAMQQIYHYIPLCVMNETFSRIVKGALLHDPEYVKTNEAAIDMISLLYLYRIGGVNKLKEQAQKTGSNFLAKWYKSVKEDAEEIIKDKIEELKDARSEADVDNVMNSKVNADQAGKINKSIDELNTEEIAELVQNKVLDVVRDEKQREEEEEEFRKDLKDAAGEEEPGENEDGTTDGSSDDNGNDNSSESDENSEEGEEQNDDSVDGDNDNNGESEGEENSDNSDSADGGSDDGDDDNGDSENEEEGEEDQSDEDNESEEPEPEKKEKPKDAQPKSEAARFARYLVDPSVAHENTLFYSIMRSIYKECIGAVKECSATPTSYNNHILHSPLNLNTLDVTLHDFQAAFPTIRTAVITDKKSLGSSSNVTTEDMLEEALAQYTLLETAMTLQLIKPSMKEVRAVSQYYLSR